MSTPCFLFYYNTLVVPSQGFVPLQCHSFCAILQCAACFVSSWVIYVIYMLKVIRRETECISKSFVSNF